MNVLEGVLILMIVRGSRGSGARGRRTGGTYGDGSRDPEQDGILAARRGDDEAVCTINAEVCVGQELVRVWNGVSHTFGKRKVIEVRGLSGNGGLTVFDVACVRSVGKGG